MGIFIDKDEPKEIKTDLDDEQMARIVDESFILMDRNEDGYITWAEYTWVG